MMRGFAFYAPHHRELQQRFTVCLISVVLFSVIAYLFKDPLVECLLRPLYLAYPALDKLVYTKLTEAFVVYLKVALLAGLFVSSPVFVYQIWMFTSPGLRATEKTVVVRTIFWSTFLFLSGAFFAYSTVLPKMLAFFMGYAGPSLQPMLKFGLYLTFAGRAVLTFGLAFEIPFLMVMVRYAGLVSGVHFRKKRKYFYIAIVTLAFLLTAGEIVATLLLSVPLFGLYEAGIIAGNIFVAEKDESSSN